MKNAKEQLQATATEAANPHRFVLVRTEKAGVFFGTLLTPEGTDVVLAGARRVWRWTGAASLSQMAMEGVSRPAECRFPCPVLRVHLFGVIEILDVTPRARKVLEAVPVWSA